MTDSNADLWLALTHMPRPSRVVDFPRNDPTGAPVGQVAIQVLSQEEQMASAAAAERVARQILKDAPKQDEARTGYDNIYNNAAAIEVLYRACRRANDLKLPFFPSPTEMRKHLTSDELGVLMSHYLTAQAELGPIVARMSEQEQDGWIKRLAEGGSMFPLDLLSSDALKTLAFSLACRLHSFSTATSSAGSPPDVATSTP